MDVHRDLAVATPRAVRLLGTVAATLRRGYINMGVIEGVHAHIGQFFAFRAGVTVCVGGVCIDIDDPKVVVEPTLQNRLRASKTRPRSYENLRLLTNSLHAYLKNRVLMIEGSRPFFRNPETWESPRRVLVRYASGCRRPAAVVKSCNVEAYSTLRQRRGFQPKLRS